MKRFASLVFVGLCAILASLTAWSDEISIHPYRGASLEDLADPVRGDPQFDRAARAILDSIPRQPELALMNPISRSLVSYEFDNLGITAMTVDLFGRDKRFAINAKDVTGGFGFLRVRFMLVPPIASVGLYQVPAHYIVEQHDLIDMNPAIQVSLKDRLAVLSDDATGFRRSFPLGVGSIDEVRSYPKVTVMTPTTELAHLDKNHLYRKRAKPTYFRNKPFIPLMVPVSRPRNGKAAPYDTTAIGFHIWQEDGFYRGFLSHGCMRMRDADLDELLSLVLGVRDVIPVQVRIPNVAGSAHPYPLHAASYNQVFNAGTAKRPFAIKKRNKEGVKLTETVTIPAIKRVAKRDVPNPDYRLGDLIAKLNWGDSMDPIAMSPEAHAHAAAMIESEAPKDGDPSGVEKFDAVETHLLPSLVAPLEH